MFYRLAIAGMLFTTMSLTAVTAARMHDRKSSSAHKPKSHPMNCTPQLAMPMPMWPAMLPALPVLAQPPQPQELPPPVAALTGETSLVHVASNMAASDVLQLIKMSLDEHVHAVDGKLAEGHDAARLLLAHASGLGPTQPMMDIAIDSPTSERHVVVFASSAR